MIPLERTQSHLHLRGNTELCLVEKVWFLLFDTKGSLQERLPVQGREKAEQHKSALAQLFPPSYHLAPLQSLLQQENYPSPFHGNEDKEMGRAVI